VLLQFIQFALYILCFYDFFKILLRIITSIESKDCYRNMFKKLQILPLQSQYIHY